MKLLWIVLVPMVLALGCGASSTRSEEVAPAASSGDGSEGDAEGHAVETEHVRGTSEQDCERRRAEASCQGCTATRSDDESSVTTVMACTSAAGAACDAICCHTCARE